MHCRVSQLDDASPTELLEARLDNNLNSPMRRGPEMKGLVLVRHPAFMCRQFKQSFARHITHQRPSSFSSTLLHGRQVQRLSQAENVGLKTNT